MTELSRRWLWPALRAIDAGALGACFVSALLLTLPPHVAVGPMEILGLRLQLQSVILFLLIIAAWRGILEMTGLYGSRCLSPRFVDEAAAVVVAVSAVTIVMWILAAAFQFEAITARFEATFWLLFCAALLGVRAAVRLALNRTRHHVTNLSHLIIVGTNCRALKFARMVQDHPALSYRLVGFVDDRWDGADSAARNGGCPIVSDFADFGAFLNSHVIDEVVVFTPVSLYKAASRLLAQCEEQGIRVRFATDIYAPTRGRSHVDQLGGHLMTTVENGGMRGEAGALKRLLDVVVSGAALVLLAPLLIAIGIIVRVTSPGPAFFRQERIGLNKRRFKVMKFRTMCVDAERRMAALEKMNEANGPVFKIRKDPRVTRVGAFLRKTSLDELPQLINVFIGDMSLVGPRPLPVRDYEGFSQDWHRRRFSVRPGITCLWQIGGRSAISFERWMELDMEYIDRWSLALDLRILLKTVPAVLKGSGAY